MIVQKETPSFITIETDRKDAIFLYNSLAFVLQNNMIQLDMESKTRMMNFVRDLGERLHITS